MCFGYLERKLSSAGGFGCTCVAVYTFDFFNIKKKDLLKPMLHTVHTVLHIMYSFEFKHSGQCHIIKTSRQAGSHLKTDLCERFSMQHLDMINIYREN